MSLATLARKTRAKQRVKSRGNFVLNMTGRGTVSHKTNRGPCGLKYNRTGTSKCTFRGSNATCCNDDLKCKQFPHGGVPAPQMGYGIYLNKKNHGGYRPSGGECCKNSEAQKNAKIVWKKSPDTDASDLIRIRKDKVLACNNDVYSQSKNKKVCLVRKNMCGCNSTDKVDYTRINHNWCTTTKAVPQNRSAGEQIARNRAAVSNECVCSYTGPLTDGPAEQCGTIKWAINQYFSTIPHGKKFSTGGIYKQYGTIEEWDTSLITNMDGLFKDRSTFNKNLGKWNLSNVTSVREMFRRASSFNNGTTSSSAVSASPLMLQSNSALSSVSAQPSLNDWDVSQVTDMGLMFDEAYMFNQDISGWKVDNVRDMSWMFFANYRGWWGNSGNYDDGRFEGDLSEWNIENVTRMIGMFDNQIKVNFDVSKWKVNKVTNMNYMFYGAANFNGIGLDQWKTDSVKDMTFMFTGAFKLGDALAIDLNGWNVENVTRMLGMFQAAVLFNGDISNWNVSSVTNMSAMFNAAQAFNANISGWGISSVTNMRSMFNGAYAFNQDIGSWDVSNVTNMSYMFANTKLFNNGGVGGENIGLDKWKVGKVTDMSLMFYNNPVFDQNIGSWDVSNVTNMTSMFDGTQLFNNGGVGGENIGLDKWKVGKVNDMSYMFYGASVFDQNIGSWKVSNVTNMSFMFYGALVFDQNIGSWKVSNVTNMRFMFYIADSFNNGGVGGKNIGLDSWDVSNVTNMEQMFNGANAFNQDIGSWNVSNVRNMEGMLGSIQRPGFNYDLGNWDVSKVTNMLRMFYGNNIFNNGGVGGVGQGLDKWDVSKVTDMREMLRQTSFFHTLQSWPTNPSGTGSGFATGLKTQWMFNLNPLLSRGIPETPSTDTVTWQNYNWP